MITTLLSRRVREVFPINELNRLTVSLRGGIERRKTCLVFSFTGQLDAYSEKQFKEYVISEISSSNLSTVVDLTNIDFLDSSGLGSLVQVAKKCKKLKKACIVVGNPRVIQTIKLVRLEEFLHLVPDLKTALNDIAA